MDEIRNQASGLGIAGFLAKPVSISALVDILADVTGRRRRDWAPASAQIDSAVMAPFAGRSILLVEDNLINQQVAMELPPTVGKGRSQQLESHWQP